MLAMLWIPWGKCRSSGDDHRKSADNPVTSKIGLDLGFRSAHCAHQPDTQASAAHRKRVLGSFGGRGKRPESEQAGTFGSGPASAGPEVSARKPPARSDGPWGWPREVRRLRSSGYSGSSRALRDLS